MQLLVPHLNIAKWALVSYSKTVLFDCSQSIQVVYPKPSHFFFLFIIQSSQCTIKVSAAALCNLLFEIEVRKSLAC